MARMRAYFAEIPESNMLSRSATRRIAFTAVSLLSALAGCAPAIVTAPAAPPPPPVLAPPPPPPLPGPPPAPDAPVFELNEVILYQPNNVLTARLGDARPLAAYIKRIEHGLTKTLAAAPAPRGFSAAEVIAVKPGPSSHAWLVSRSRLPDGLAAQLDAAAEAVPPVTVQGGPIAFAIVFAAYGGGGKPVVDKAHPIPIPREWRDDAPAVLAPDK
jgi:hypothetical protein